MATSDVQVCSNALLMLGAQTINSFDDESDRATLVANLWPNMRDAVLRSHPWNCAKKRKLLAPDAAAPDFEFAYQFSLPSDCMRVLSVGEEGETIRYKIEGRKLLTDEAQCKLGYVFRNEDVTTWDALLVSSAEAFVAMTCAYPITKSAAQQQNMLALWQAKLREARTVDGLEEPTDDVGDKPFLNVRR